MDINGFQMSRERLRLHGTSSRNIYNVLGQKVRSMVNQEESAGLYTVTWDGKSNSGQSVSTGIYLYRFQAGDYVETKKMLLLK